MTRMPVVFIGHGSPMNTLASNQYTHVWREIGLTVPRPRALLVISAHWCIEATAVTAMAKPRTIHDFYGFPPELFAFQYPAPGAPDVAAEVAETAKPRWVGLDKEQWGLDHGTWSVLAHMYPAADIPVVQLSINGLKPLKDHLDLAARLAPLRDRGVLIVASGNVVHNLRLIDRTRGNEGFDWARRFDDAVHDQLASDPADILSVTGHRDYVLAVPTPDHFVPLLYLAGLATKEEPPQAVVRGYSLASLSMTCYALGADIPPADEGAGAASLPSGIPADDTNT
jgi:4,5-DOPA dioxygenase extradiol